MSGFDGFRKKQQAAEPAEAERSPLRCAAHGCPLVATVSPGSTGRFFCHCHAWVGSDEWQAVTRAIRDHDWFHSFNCQVARMGKGWADFADEFWSGQDEFMRPTASERQHQPNYVTRLMAEFEYRVGARSRRPQPIEPKAIPVRGVKVAGFVGVSA